MRPRQILILPVALFLCSSTVASAAEIRRDVDEHGHPYFTNVPREEPVRKRRDAQGRWILYNVPEEAPPAAPPAEKPLPSAPAVRPAEPRRFSTVVETQPFQVDQRRLPITAIEVEEIVDRRGETRALFGPVFANRSFRCAERNFVNRYVAVRGQLVPNPCYGVVPPILEPFPSVGYGPGR